ncbi:hypothetical protein, partial [Paraburkholderia caribensis]|uniref:hypothetical protein n=1 Tax=Paraburkholderia caribensis TaxID=75105 RepID=UPI0020913DAF
AAGTDLNERKQRLSTQYGQTKAVDQESSILDASADAQMKDDADTGANDPEPRAYFSIFCTESPITRSTALMNSYLGRPPNIPAVCERLPVHLSE